MSAPETILVADIGGTNARFALASAGPDRPVLHSPRALATTQFENLEQAARHYLDKVRTRPARAVFAVASPVRGDDIRLTNRAWSFNRSELAARLALDDLQILNDFGAAARVVPVLRNDEIQVLHGPKDAPLDAPVSVLGPGTGFGVALLTHHLSGWNVIETEGGHISFAPLDHEEQRIRDWLAKRHGRVSVERVLSGRGLSKIDAILNNRPTDIPDAEFNPPAEIVCAAVAGDPHAKAALSRFCAILGSVAGDTALIHGAHTVAIAGGIVPRFVPFLRSSAFRESFLDKGRFAAHLEAVRIAVVTHPEPGLLGAALTLLDRPNRKA